MRAASGGFRKRGLSLAIFCGKWGDSADKEFFSFILLNILTFSVPELAFGFDAPAAFPAFFKGGGGGVGAGAGFG